MQEDDRREFKKTAAHRHARITFYTYGSPRKNPYETGSEEWIWWASCYGTLCHQEKADRHRCVPLSVRKEIEKDRKEKIEFNAARRQAMVLRNGIGKYQKLPEEANV